MKYPTRVSDAVHIMVFIHLDPTQDLSSTAIAYSIKTNPSYVRQLMAALKKAAGHLPGGGRGQAPAPLGYPHQPRVRCRRQYPTGAQ